MIEPFDPATLPPPPRRPAGVRFLVAAIALMLFLGGSAAWISAEYQRGLAASDLLSACYERRIVIADLMSRMRDAEMEARDYRLTRDGAHRDRYRSATGAVGVQRARLKTLLPGLPKQAARFRQLEQAVDARLRDLDAVVTSAGTLREASVPRSHVDGDVRSPLRRVRAIVGAMTAEEDRMIVTRYANWIDHAAVTQRNVWTLVATLAVLICGGLTLAWRAQRLRYRLGVQAQVAAARLRGVFSGSSDVIALLDPRGRIEAVNPAVTRLLGHEPAALIGRDIAVLVDALPPGGTLAERIGMDRQGISEPLRMDRVAHHADGHAMPVDVALGLMPMSSGLHVVAMIRDISERKAVDRLKDEFIATVSHELRTPLTSIVGALGLLRATSGDTLPEAARRLVTVAEENSRRLIDLVNDLLDVEKMDAGAFRFRNQPLDLAIVLRRAAQGSEGLANLKQVVLELAIVPGTLQVRGDDGRLLQVVTNLLANAVRFSPPAGTVTLSAERSEGRAIVTVEDRGPGVPEAFRSHLFTRFAQSDEAGSAGGTGLGLAIARQIVRAHGGALWFEPRPGGGARFRFSIDLRDAGGEPPHLLICAEAPDGARQLRELAEAGGCSADRVETPADARVAIRSAAYDAVLIDLDAGGPAAAQLLAQMQDEAVGGCLPIPVVARTKGVVRVGVGLDQAAWSRIREADGGLAARLQRIMEGLGDEKPLIVQIDGDGRLFDRTAAALHPQARMRHAPDLAAVDAILRQEKPALIIAEQELPDGQVDDLLIRLRDSAVLRDIPVILYSARPVPAARERNVEVAVMKSPRSSRNLAVAVDRLLARAGVPIGGAGDDAGVATDVMAS